MIPQVQRRLEATRRSASLSIFCVIVPALLLLSFFPPNHRSGQATGELTVTAVVASSVSVTFAPDGTPSIVVANAPADAEPIARTSSQPRERKAAQSYSRRNKPVKAR
jgi:hypothetical protein